MTAALRNGCAVALLVGAGLALFAPLPLEAAMALAFVAGLVAGPFWRWRPKRRRRRG